MKKDHDEDEGGISSYNDTIMILMIYSFNFTTL